MTSIPPLYTNAHTIVIFKLTELGQQEMKRKLVKVSCMEKALSELEHAWYMYNNIILQKLGLLKTHTCMEIYS